MTKEEVKQWIRNQIDSSVKKQSKYNNAEFYLRYNKSYLRALKLSKITGKPVNKENFKGGGNLFSFNCNSKSFWYFPIIGNFLYASSDSSKRIKIIEEVLNEYEEYKGYTIYW